MFFFTSRRNLFSLRRHLFYIFISVFCQTVLKKIVSQSFDGQVCRQGGFTFKFMFANSCLSLMLDRSCGGIAFYASACSIVTESARSVAKNRPSRSNE